MYIKYICNIIMYLDLNYASRSLYKSSEKIERAIKMIIALLNFWWAYR